MFLGPRLHLAQLDIEEIYFYGGEEDEIAPNGPASIINIDSLCIRESLGSSIALMIQYWGATLQVKHM